MDLTISKKNEVFLKIDSKEPHIFCELSDIFTFEVPGAKFMPQYRNKYWDGKIRLFNQANGEIYVGLLDKVISFCKKSDYQYEFVHSDFYGTPFEENGFISLEGVKDYMNKITRYEPRQYQIQGVFDALKYNRKLLISPTASGKSLMIYTITRYMVDKGHSVLLVVPTTSLVEQMYKDFIDYGWNSDENCHRIYAGKEKHTDKPVTITTWQSIYKLEHSFFKKYGCVIGDEAHLFKSKSLIRIMTKLHDAKYRFGFTGTLDGTQTHKWVLEGLFGPAYKIVRTDELIEKGHLAKLNIKILLLQHESQRFDTYEDEVQFIIQNERRNNFIKKLTLDLKGNTLLLYSRVESHGEILFNIINSDTNRKVFFVHGGVAAEEREEIRKITEEESNAIIVASYGTFSTGINIKNLHNVIFASPSKSRIRNLQSIGRVLRKGSNKFKATLYDIADDCRVTLPNLETKKNYTLNHLLERIKIYNEEHFNYDLVRVSLKEKQ